MSVLRRALRFDKSKIPVFLLLASVLVLYAQTLGFGLLRFDDPDYTIACSFVKGGLTWANVCEAFSNFRHGGIWMPLTYLSYMCDISFLGGSAAAFHLTNVLLHALNVLLLGRLLGALGVRSRPLAFVLVAFWALHPQRVEAVAWVAARKELLWSLFALLGLLAWLRDRRLGAFLCMALACLSKPTAMVFPFLAVAADLIRSRRRAYACYLPFLVLSVATGLVAIYSQTHPEGMAVKELFYLPLPHRLMNAVNAIGLYIAQTLVPIGLHFDYRAVASFWPLCWYVGLPVALATGYLVFRFGATQPAFWALATLLPTLGIFGSFGEHARADRFWYLASMAFPLAIAPIVPAARTRLATLGLGALALVFAGIAYVRIGDYRNDRTVFERTLRCDARHGRALAHVGEAKCAAGELDAGIAMLHTSRTERPRFDTDAKLAYALMRRGRAEDLREIRTVCADVAKDPACDAKGQALEALGTAELVAGEWPAAALHLSRSIVAPRRFYSDADARLKLAYALHNAGERKRAEELFAAAYKSTRRDLSEKAEEAITALADDPNAVLFW